MAHEADEVTARGTDYKIRLNRRGQTHVFDVEKTRTGQISDFWWRPGEEPGTGFRHIALIPSMHKPN